MANRSGHHALMSTAPRGVLFVHFSMCTFLGFSVLSHRRETEAAYLISSSAGRLEPGKIEDINPLGTPGTTLDFNLNPRIVYRKQ